MGKGSGVHPLAYWEAYYSCLYGVVSHDGGRFWDLIRFQKLVRKLS